MRPARRRGADSLSSSDVLTGSRACRDRLGVAAGAQQRPGTGIGEGAPFDDVNAVDEDAIDAVRVAIQPWRSAGKIEAHPNLAGTDRVGIDEDDVGEPARGDPAPVPHTVET